MLISSHFTFDNDDMKSSKRRVTSLLSLIFFLKCISKSTTSSSPRQCIEIRQLWSRIRHNLEGQWQASL